MEKDRWPMLNMTAREQNEAIARWMDAGDVLRGINYCGDLNAMHESEKRLSKEQFIYYVDSWLCRVVADNPGSVFSDDTGLAPAMVHATAAQRAEALLKTLGLWKSSNE